MFLRARFNARNRATGIRGWTRHVRGNRGGFKPAELRVFLPGGDYFWYGARFVVWGEQVVLGSYGIDLPFAWQYGLPQSPWPRRVTALADPS